MLGGGGRKRRWGRSTCERRAGGQRDRGVTWGRIETSTGGRDLVDSPEYPITGRRYRDVVGPRPPVACFSASSWIGTSGRRFIVRESLTATELWPEHLAEPRPVHWPPPFTSYFPPSNCLAAYANETALSNLWETYS